MRAVICMLAAAPCMAQIIHEDVELIAGFSEESDRYGEAVAIGDGVVCVGATGSSHLAQAGGAAFLFDAQTGDYLGEFIPDDVGPLGFGSAMAIRGGLAAIGASFDITNGVGAGSAYVFDVETGDQLYKIYAADPMALDSFGDAVAIGGGLLAVGSPFADLGAVFNTGAVYVYDVDDGAFIAKIVPADAATGEIFGGSLAIDDGVLAVGAARDGENFVDGGAVYLFDAATLELISKIVPDDLAFADFFGASVDLDDGVLAVGSLRDDGAVEDSGSVYLFDVATGDQLARLLPDEGVVEGFFGYSVDIEGDLLVVGARFEHAAYMYDVSAAKQLAKLLPSEPEKGLEFGVAVAIHDDSVVVGAAELSQIPGDPGKAYLFHGCAADVNDDFRLDVLDFVEFQLLWLASNERADCNDDGAFDILDFSCFQEQFLAGGR